MQQSAHFSLPLSNTKSQQILGVLPPIWLFQSCTMTLPSDMYSVNSLLMLSLHPWPIFSQVRDRSFPRHSVSHTSSFLPYPTQDKPSLPYPLPLPPSLCSRTVLLPVSELCRRSLPSALHLGLSARCPSHSHLLHLCPHSFLWSLPGPQPRSLSLAPLTVALS